jgi:hypothetical protein
MYSVPTKLETGYDPERAYAISNREMSPINAGTETRLHLSFGQQACHFTVIRALFELGQQMGMCKIDVFKHNLIIKEI